MLKLLTKAGNCYIVLLWLALLATFAAFVNKCMRGIWAPYELEYGEGVVLWQASHIFNLKEAFGSMQKVPYIVFQYTPLYHVLSRIVGFAVGDTLVAGRLVSFASALLVGAVLGALVFRCLPARMPASIRLTGAVTGGLICYSLENLEWMRFMRVDGLAVALSFLGLYWFILGLRRPVLEYAAFFCFFLAIYTKQAMVTAPAACWLAAVIVSPRRSLRLLLLLASCGLVTLAVLMYATDGRVAQHWFLYNRNLFSFLQLCKKLKFHFLDVKILAILAAGQVFAYCFRLGSLSGSAMLRRIRAGLQHSLYQRGMFILGVHMVLAFLAGFSAGKAGAAYNYFLTWNLACCPLVGLLVATTLYGGRSGILSATQTAVLLFALLASAERLHMSSFSRSDPEHADWARDSVTVLRRIRSTAGLVYSENMTLLMQAGKEPPAGPDIITVLSQAGFWDERPFLAMIRSGAFEQIVVTSSLSDRGRFTDGAAAAIEESYALTEKYGVYKIYTPRTREPITGSATMVGSSQDRDN